MQNCYLMDISGIAFHLEVNFIPEIQLYPFFSTWLLAEVQVIIC